MLARLRSDPSWQVEALVTTVNESNGRVAMHGTSDVLLRMQAESLGLPLTVVGLPEHCDNRTYEARLAKGLQPYHDRDIDTIACGDLFLEDIRRWRERSFGAMGWETIFPIWHTPSDELARRLTRAPWRVVITCIDRQLLPQDLLGKRFDAGFLKDLPEKVDPCGENGEFHTYVCNGPGFQSGIPVAAGREVVVHDRFAMVDLELQAKIQ